MNIQVRRRFLITDRNPDIRLDYLITIAGHMATQSDLHRSVISLRYVPDKVIMQPESFGHYLDALGTLEWDSLEEAAAAVLNDVNNEIIARWLQVRISAPEQVHPGINAHEVLFEDRQPNWDNSRLLSRLKRH
jgi:7-cyano-7-deazaguanine reductase